MTDRTCTCGKPIRRARDGRRYALCLACREKGPPQVTSLPAPLYLLRPAALPPVESLPHGTLLAYFAALHDEVLRRFGDLLSSDPGTLLPGSPFGGGIAQSRSAASGHSREAAPLSAGGRTR